MPRYYAGVGSRDTPEDVQQIETRIALALANHGFILRSGGARGSDQAFERGAGSAKEIFYGNPRHEIAPQRYGPIPTGEQHHLVTDSKLATMAEAIISTTMRKSHWDNICKSSYSKNLYRRNAFQILGQHLDDPVELLVCWAPVDNGQIRGGTASGYRLAKELGIPVYNLLNESDLATLRTWVQSGCHRQEELDRHHVIDKALELLEWANTERIIWSMQNQKTQPGVDVRVTLYEPRERENSGIER